MEQDLAKHFAETYEKFEGMDQDGLRYMADLMASAPRSFTYRDFAEKFAMMMVLQKRFDARVFEKYGLTYKTVGMSRISLALDAELGEFVQEFKPMWVYWKENPGEVDRSKALEELADIWHFFLSLMLWTLNTHGEEINLEMIGNDMVKGSRMMVDFGNGDRKDLTGDEAIDSLMMGVEMMKNEMNIFALSACAGFSMDEVYRAYLEKNVTNHHRLDNHY